MSKTLENNTSVNYAFDDANRMTLLDNQKSLVSFARFDYGYDSVDRRTFVKRDQNKGDVFSYDPVDQVTGVKYEAQNPDSSPSAPLREVSYSLDATGNWTELINNGKKQKFTSNNLNEYTLVTGVTGIGAIKYDGNGNMAMQNGWKYTHDAQNRLIEAKKGNIRVAFSHDPRNRCVNRTIFNTGEGALKKPGVTTFFFFDGWSLIEERSSSDAQLTRYIHGAQVDEILSKTSGGNTVYYHHDSIGDTVRLTNASGNVIEKYSFDIYGAPTIKDANNVVLTASAFGNRFLFTGREFITEIGLYDYRNRFYSPEFGRFLQPDPLGFAAGDANLYRYVENDPVNEIDPFGLQLFSAEALAGPAEIGVVASLKAKVIVKTAVEVAKEKFPKDFGKQNAYQHCLGSIQSPLLVSVKSGQVHFFYGIQVTTSSRIALLQP